MRQLRELLAPLTSAVRWQPAGAATALVMLLLLFLSSDPQPWRAVMLLHLAAIILACGACFVLDDGAADLLAASPTTLRWRRSVRIVGAAVVLVAPVWAASVVLVTQRSGVDVPALALTLELAALVAVGLAAAAALERWTGLVEAGVAAAPLLFLLAFLAFRLPQRWALFVAPEADQFGVNLRWSAILVAALLLLAWCTRDPAARLTLRSAARR